MKMESLGQYLRKLREERGKSIQDVAEETKLQERYITALEEDRFEELPGEVYAKPFLKAYAQFLGVDRKELYSRYETQRGPTKRQVAPTVEEARAGFPRWIIVGAILIVVLAVVFLLLSLGRKGSGPVSPISGGETDTAQVEPGEKSEPRPIMGTVSRDSGRARVDQYPDEERAPISTARAAMRLGIVASDSSWLEVVGDEDTLFYGFITAGEKVELEAEEGFVLTAGKPELIRFYLDGKPLMLPFGRSRTIYQFKLDRSRAYEYTQSRGDTARERR